MSYRRMADQPGERQPNEHLRDWLSKATPERRESVASKAKTTVAYMWQLAGGHRHASAALGMRLQKASGGEITLAGLCPEISQAVQESLKQTA